MAQDIHRAKGSSLWGTDSAPPRAYVGAFMIAGGATCLGGATAIFAVASGASALVSLTLMAACVLLGFVSAVVVVRAGARRNRRKAVASGISGRKAGRGQRRAARQDRRQLRRDRREMRRTAVCSPAIMLEEELSARYGARVERVATHVWRIDGDLVEATLDPVTGQLMTGGRELKL